MADQLLYPGSVLALRADAADRLMASGNGDAALLYLHLLRAGGPFRPQGAVHALKWDPGRAEAGFSGLAFHHAAELRVFVRPADYEQALYLVRKTVREAEAGE